MADSTRKSFHLMYGVVQLAKMKDYRLKTLMIDNLHIFVNYPDCPVLQISINT